jgi:hypothetical protein
MKAFSKQAGILTNLSSINVLSWCEVKLLDGNRSRKWEESAFVGMKTVSSLEPVEKSGNPFGVREI